MKTFSSDQFTWNKGRGVADLTNLIGPKFESITMFEVKSTRTGAVRTFELDSNDPGYEDGWDGEFRVYTDNQWDGCKITILND